MAVVKRFEITVLMATQPGAAGMMLTDRCVVEAEDTADAARKYAALFPSSDENEDSEDDEDYTAEIKADPCAVCGTAPTEGTTEAGERVCGPHGAADQRRGEDIAWDEDAPQQYMLVPVDPQYQGQDV
jgi:hypothetical protein